MNDPIAPKSTRSYTPVLQRQNPMPFRLQLRDIEILKVIFRYRFLRTTQIKRLVFPENRSIQSTRKRLKYLFHNGFVGRINPFVAPGMGQPDTAYFLEKVGAELLQPHLPDEEIRVSSKSGKVGYQFLSHALELSEFRLQLELALKDHPTVQLKRFVADFEIKSHLENAVGKHRYKLFHQVEHPTTRQNFVVYPDALVILQGKAEYEHQQKLFFVEIDRGTENQRRIQEKVIGYHLYKELKLFQKFGKFRNFKVLLQTTSPKRARNMRNTLMNLQGSELVWIADRQKVTELSILHESIWQNHLLEWKSVINTAAAKQSPDEDSGPDRQQEVAKG